MYSASFHGISQMETDALLPGLMLSIGRQSIEPLAANLQSVHASALHQSLHRFVWKTECSDLAPPERVRCRVLLHINPAKELYSIIDLTGFPKQGKPNGNSTATH
jgi:SRSO17 transposase